MQVFRALRVLAAAAVLASAVAAPAWSATPSADAEPSAGSPQRSAPAYRSPDSGPAVHHDTSPPLRTLASLATEAPITPQVKPKQKLSPSITEFPSRPTPPDSVVQDYNGSRRASVRTGFDGISGQGSTPPDSNASVGSLQIVETVNTDLAVYSRTGATQLGPIPTNTLWSGFGGLCETNNDGDAVVRWDTLARRWVITQFAYDDPSGTYRECVGVSTTRDATGSYHRYDFAYELFNDYPKLAVWPDAYYVTYNVGIGTEACALDRRSMLRGEDAEQQCFIVPTPPHNGFAGFLLGSDLDGTNPPPKGAPNLLVTLGANNNTLQYWRFSVNWVDQARTTVTGPGELPVAPYIRACQNTDPEQCVPQAGTAQRLDSLSYWPMYRLAYRNFGKIQSLVFNHAVEANGGVGVRWYELKLRNGRPVVHQQSTFAPSSTYRWMGSAAMNKVGDIALGHSHSSIASRPSIRVTGRLAKDKLNRMTFRETTLQNGAGSQIGNERWGDYTSMAIDPVDDCTFWYTNQYQPADGAGNWRTRIASFRLSDCRAHEHHDKETSG